MPKTCTGAVDATALTLIVVSYNTRDLTLACLRSVYERTRDLRFEVIVVDNASPDGSADAIAAEFPQVRLFALDENLGFAAANNFAARHATGEWLLLLNPDTVVLGSAIQRLHAFATLHSDAGIFGGRTVFADGSLNPKSCWGRPTPWSAFFAGIGLSAVFKGTRWFDPESLGGWARDTVRQVDIVTGCFFLLRRELWQRLGGFDPAFFMYAEEADLCLRARRLGLRCLICPEAEIIHYGGASEPVRADKIVRLFRAKAQLFQKHWSPPAARFGVWTLDLRAFTRLLAFAAAGLVQPRHAEAFRTWREIWRRRPEWHSVAEPAAVPSAGIGRG